LAISYVTLRVFDVSGRDVAALIEQELQPGRHQVQFNASGLSSGVYFYRLSTGSFSQTKKMIILQ
jgi:hypothetical protein